jgi:GxxExxY protein
MPIECSVPIQPLVQDEFHSLDKIVMKHAFAVHNQLGRFFDEKIYQAELIRRCQQDGIAARHEVMISVTYRTFRKDFFLDAVFSSGAVYELKCVASLAGGNESQLIRYLLLAGVQHGKLINFRPPSVESRFVSTGLTHEKRQTFHLDVSRVQSAGAQCKLVKGLIPALLKDRGAFLSVELYREAVVHFLGGEQQVVCPVEVLCDGQTIGRKNICLIDGKSALHLSAMTHGLVGYETHLHRFLCHTKLDSIQWINFNQDQISFRTVLQK